MWARVRISERGLSAIVVLREAERAHDVGGKDVGLSARVKAVRADLAVGQRDELCGFYHVNIWYTMRYQK